MGLKHPVQYSEKLMPQLAVREKKKWREEEGEREGGGGGETEQAPWGRIIRIVEKKITKYK